MPRKPPDGNKERNVDYDRLWRVAEAERKSQEPGRLRAWLNWMKEHQHDAPFSSWLVIPCNLNDYGQRPLASATPFWASPFIWVESPDPSGRPLAGAENFLVAQIFNFGAATAAPTKVDFYVKEPSLGLGAGDPNVFEALAKDLHDQWIEVQPMRPGGPPGTRFLRCSKPWIPTYDYDGHECAFVICDNHILDSAPRHPFEPWNDRRVGQSNLFVLPAVEQAFHLWSPMGLPEAPAEIRVLALRAIAPGGFERRSTDFATITRAAHEVLRGLRLAPTTARTDIESAERPVFYAERIASERVIRGLRALDETRAIRNADATFRVSELASGANFGELALRLADAHGTALRLELNLHAVDLAPNEIVVLNIVRVTRGTVTGGYTVALVNPTWFKKSPITAKGGKLMKETKDKGNELEHLVIEHNPQARITYQIARQLERHLPIPSPDALKEAIDEIVIDEHRLPFELFEPYITEALFPIKEVQDLVRKLTAATRFALESVAQAPGAIQNASVRAIVSAGLHGELGRFAPASSAYAVKSSAAGQALFSPTHTKGGK